MFQNQNQNQPKSLPAYAPKRKQNCVLPTVSKYFLEELEKASGEHASCATINAVLNKGYNVATVLTLAHAMEIPSMEVLEKCDEVEYKREFCSGVLDYVREEVLGASDMEKLERGMEEEVGECGEFVGKVWAMVQRVWNSLSEEHDVVDPVGRQLFDLQRFVWDEGLLEYGEEECCSTTRTRASRRKRVCV